MWYGQLVYCERVLLPGTGLLPQDDPGHKEDYAWPISTESQSGSQS